MGFTDQQFSSSVPQMAMSMQEHMSASMPESRQPYICYVNLLCLKMIPSTY